MGVQQLARPPAQYTESQQAIFIAVPLKQCYAATCRVHVTALNLQLHVMQCIKPAHMLSHCRCREEQIGPTRTC